MRTLANYTVRIEFEAKNDGNASALAAMIVHIFNKYEKEARFDLRKRINRVFSKSLIIYVGFPYLSELEVSDASVNEEK